MENKGTGMDYSLQQLKAGLAAHRYICEHTIATVLYMAERMGRPL